MRKTTPALALFVIIAAIAFTAPAHAQPTRTWISGIGVDSGTCPRQSPCHTLTYAHGQVAPGGEITVLDLTEGSVALDLIGFARTADIDPLVWVLPDDLPRLDLGTGLGRDALADHRDTLVEELADDGQLTEESEDDREKVP